ncbi:hypothetical protein WJ96_04310 [Burkholderia ubonensis]|uniref:Uncharacterized protein n=1 Tax=Burkholderia ubonensis TaxID=101571 RepID=A0AAW3MV40_9BURK|nr:hypothetical protein [Burkholderia ubonensis]KVP65596.1 hypothetical protein WJ93_24050 [Burkholderia ubonensis]KVP97798.1 hypothetical protein WJ96_04310 [Burkholderia ubonensis]KVZ92495.1 hypothetical protein WL25_15965 [Burkholderia ubonensis]
MTATQQIKLSRGAILGLVAGVIALCGWMYLALSVLMPALWGPYAFAFSEAGPLVLSRGGMISAFFVFPAMAVIYPLRYGKSIVKWAAVQACTALLAGAALLGYGYYLHNIIHLQGVDASLDFLAMEVGFNNAAAVPAHVKEAFILSDKLASGGKQTWLPGAWKSVDWPAIPAKQVR